MRAIGAERALFLIILRFFVLHSKPNRSLVVLFSLKINALLRSHLVRPLAVFLQLEHALFSQTTLNTMFDMVNIIQE